MVSAIKPPYFFIIFSGVVHLNLNAIRHPKIPFFVTLYCSLLVLIGTYLGISTLFNPSLAVGYVEGAEMIAGAWAGRTLGIALAMALVIWFRNAQVYAVVFLASACREGGDIIGAIYSGNSSLIPVLGAFFLLDLVCLFLCARALKTRSSPLVETQE